MDVDHILNESASPVDAPIFEMWCGANCVAFSDGTLVPALDFYLENAAEKSNCEPCKARHKSGHITKVEKKEPALV